MNWIELKALNSLYHKGVVKINETLSKSSEINYLITSLKVLEKNSREIKTVQDFKSIYEEKYLEKFIQYNTTHSLKITVY
jgi:ketol-acid reductoisomerase